MEKMRCIGGQLLPGPMRTLKDLPVIAVACAVMQFSVKADGSPTGIYCFSYYFSSNFSFCFARSHGMQYWTDLRWVNAPHARETKLQVGAPRSRLHRLGIRKLGDNAMRRNLAVRMAGRGDFHLRAQHERMLKLTAGRHGAIGNGTAMGRHKVHQAKAQRLHPRMCCNLESAVDGSGRLYQNLQHQTAI